jgi:Cof subfamily protein (haloacid dehalogenase superfamily)
MYTYLMKKLTFIFDLDGTLIDPARYEVPTSAILALQDLYALGHRCCIATGRSYESIMQTMVKDIIPWDGFICSNGQHVLDQHGHTIDKYVMDTQRIHQAVELAKSYGMNVQFQGNPSFMLKEIDEVVIKAHSFFHEPIPTLIKEYEDEPLDMLMIYHEDVDKLLSFKEIPGLEVYCGRSTYADVVDMGQSKYRGISVYFEKLNEGINYIAFGDSDNDMDMIANAKLGFAMGNATDELKSIAHVVTPRVDEDGIAWGIKEALKQIKTFG